MLLLMQGGRRSLVDDPALLDEGAEVGGTTAEADVYSGGGNGVRRSLRWQADLLDGFRRGWQRGDCANEVRSVSACCY